MAKKSTPGAAVQSSTRGDALFWEFANANLTPEQLKQRAAPLLNNKELLRNVRALTPGDQTKFIDRVDQVCRNDRIAFLKTHPPLLLQRHIQLSSRKMRNP